MRLYAEDVTLAYDDQHVIAKNLSLTIPDLSLIHI